jgi:Zn-dependent alcohol dehydrogenase
MHWRPGSGIEAKPAKYRWKGNDLNSGWVTTFNRHSVVSENRITKIEPGTLQKEIIPLMGCALTTALGVLEKEAKANFRDSLLILGAGGVGLTLVKVAKFLGVSNIVIVDTDKSKIVKEKEIGANSGVVFQNK